MKVIALTLTTLCLAGLAQAYVDYNLKCTQQEMGVRWPSYHSNSEYYMCAQQSGKQLTISCNPGEVFTFVLQSCTHPSKFIPPPPMDVLPTSPPILAQPEAETHPINFYPGNLPIISNHPMHPPILIDEPSQSWEMPHVIEVEEPQSVESEEESIVPPPPGPSSLLHHNKPLKPVATPPTPPTPAPTPPMVVPPKKPSALKKPLAPSATKPQAPSATKPQAPSAAKPQAPSAAKKTPPVPAKKPMPALPSKA